LGFLFVCWEHLPGRADVIKRAHRVVKKQELKILVQMEKRQLLQWFQKHPRRMKLLKSSIVVVAAASPVAVLVMASPDIIHEIRDLLKASRERKNTQRKLR
jgi:hypothetical protein